jgi:tRNA(Ile)-lysidine synthase
MTFVAKPKDNWCNLIDSFLASMPPSDYAELGVVVAMSGGADSVALLRLLVESWERYYTNARDFITVAHFNHGIRGVDSDNDQLFVEQLAEEIGVRCIAKKALASGDSDYHENQSAPSLGSENLLRRQRYAFLNACLEITGSRCLLVAHNADDQIESVLHNLFRGTGPVGLCGMKNVREIEHDYILLRPLLGIRSYALRNGLREINQDWREDKSNYSNRYQRNWIRNSLLPRILDRYKEADLAILRLIATQNDWYISLGRQARDWVHQNVDCNGSQVFIRRSKLNDRAVFGIALAMVWDKMGWQRSELTMAHYHNIFFLVESSNKRLERGGHGKIKCTKAIDLPGRIRASQVAQDTVLISKSISP